MGAVPMRLDPAGFAALLAADIARYGDLLPRAGIRLD